MQYMVLIASMMMPVSAASMDHFFFGRRVVLHSLLNLRISRESSLSGPRLYDCDVHAPPHRPPATAVCEVDTLGSASTGLELAWCSPAAGIASHAPCSTLRLELQ